MIVTTVCGLEPLHLCTRFVGNKFASLARVWSLLVCVYVHCRGCRSCNVDCYLVMLTAVDTVSPCFCHNTVMQCLNGDKTATEAIKCNSQPDAITTTTTSTTTTILLHYITWEDNPDFSSLDGVL